MNFNFNLGQASTYPPVPLHTVSGGLITAGVTFNESIPFILPERDTRSSVAVPNKKIIQDAFESPDGDRSGLQNQKPEIILMTEFSPLKNSLNEDTDAGKYFNLIL